MKKYKNKKLLKKITVIKPKIIAIADIQPLPIFTKSKPREIHKYDIYYADLGEGVGCEQSFKRPVCICQNDTGNKYSATTIICPLTTVAKHVNMPTKVPLNTSCGLEKNSYFLGEQIRTIDKKRLQDKVGEITNPKLQEKINNALRISLGL